MIRIIKALPRTGSFMGIKSFAKPIMTVGVRVFSPLVNVELAKIGTPLFISFKSSFSNKFESLHKSYNSQGTIAGFALRPLHNTSVNFPSEFRVMPKAIC